MEAVLSPLATHTIKGPRSMPGYSRMTYSCACVPHQGAPSGVPTSTSPSSAKQLTGICFWPDREYDEVIILPSITETAQALARTKGISFYEHRTLFELALLKDPSIKRLIFLCSLPVDPAVLRYYWSVLLKDVMPFSEVKKRFVQLSLNDPTVRPLSYKILENPEFIDKVKNTLSKTAKSCLIPWLVTPAEHEVANKLGVSILSHEAEHYAHGTKAGSIKIFKEANVPYPFGTELVRTEEELATTLFDLWRRGAIEERRRDVHQVVSDGRRQNVQEHMDRYVVKLDDSASGGGNALFDMKNVLQRCGLLEDRDRLSTSSDTDEFESWLGTHRDLLIQGILQEFPNMAFQGRDESWPTYRKEIPTQGVHAELYIDHQFAPSCQAIISTDRSVTILSTHEQVLDGHVYQGCKFPCNHAYRRKIQEYTLRIGQVLAEKGALGYFGVDFLASRTMPAAACLTNPDTCDPDQTWELFAVEINLRQSGTTHPMMLAKLLTRGQYDNETGMLETSSGDLKYYVANDNVVNPLYTSLSPANVIAGVEKEKDIHYCHDRETGVMFHLLSPVRDVGKIGILCIGNTREEADEFAVRARHLLDRLATSAAAAPSASVEGSPATML